MFRMLDTHQGVTGGAGLKWGANGPDEVLTWQEIDLVALTFVTCADELRIVRHIGVDHTPL